MTCQSVAAMTGVSLPHLALAAIILQFIAHLLSSEQLPLYTDQAPLKDAASTNKRIGNHLAKTLDPAVMKANTTSRAARVLTAPPNILMSIPASYSIPLFWDRGRR